MSHRYGTVEFGTRTPRITEHCCSMNLYAKLPESDESDESDEQRRSATGISDARTNPRDRAEEAVVQCAFSNPELLLKS